MISDQKLHSLHIVFVLVTTLNETPAGWGHGKLSSFCLTTKYIYFFKNKICLYSPGYLFIAPLWPIGTSILQGFEHQQVALSVAQQQISIGPAGCIEKPFHSLMDGETELVKHHLTSTGHEALYFQRLYVCKVSALPSAAGRVQQCHPWSFWPRPQPPAGCARPGSKGSWPEQERWHEDVVPSQPCTSHRSGPHHQ